MKETHFQLLVPCPPMRIWGIKMKKRVLLCVVFIISTILLSGCQEVLEVSVGIDETMKGKTSALSSISRYEMTDNDYNTLETEAVEINLNDLNEGIEGIYTYDNQILTICAAGDYVISGKMDNGSLTIKVFDDENVHLFLNGAEIKSNKGAAIFVESAAKVIITVKEGTENILSASSKQGGTQKACIFSNTDLTINGGGSLFVYGYQADAVRSKDQLKVVNTNLYVKAKRDGIRGNDGVIIYDSITEVECEGIGIISNSDKDMVVLQGGSCKVIAGENAIAANQYVSIHDSQLDLYSVLEAVKCDGIREIDGDLPQ